MSTSPKDEEEMADIIPANNDNGPSIVERIERKQGRREQKKENGAQEATR